MKILMLGMPGSGKGTQSKLLSTELKMDIISTGELIRTSDDPKLKEIVNKGELIDDQTMFDMVLNKIKNNTYILDGFPRNLVQAKMIDVDLVFYLMLDDEEAVRRVLSRGHNRADDRESIVRERLKIYYKETDPLVEYYEEMGVLKKIDGRKPPNEVMKTILKIISENKK